MINNKELISLTLTNIVNEDSEINLLALPSGGNSNVYDTYYKLPFEYNNGDGFLFVYLLGNPPVSNNYYLYATVDIDAMILELNTNFSSYALFTYEVNGSAPDYFLIIKVLDSSFVPYSLQTLI